MRAVLVTTLIFTLLVGVGSIVFYYAQDYTYSLDLENDISTSDIHVILSSSGIWNWNGTVSFLNESEKNIELISMSLGKMKFKNNGVISRIVELPKLIACFDFKNTSVKQAEGYPSSWDLWPVYTIYEPIFTDSKFGAGQAISPGSYGYDEIYYPQTFYRGGYGQLPIEIKTGDELIYYISLKNAFVKTSGRNPDIFKNGKIEIYNLPIKEPNPLSNEMAYDGIYNSNCAIYARDFDPVKTIEII